MHSEQINELAAALAKAQSAFSDVVKDKKAEVGKYAYTYADLASVLQAVRKPLSENGLALAQVTHSENGAFWLESCLLHNSGQYITATWPLPAQGTPQQIGSALTYARRYTASALLGIASEDDDGAAGGDAKPSSGPPAKSSQKDKRPPWEDAVEPPHETKLAKRWINWTDVERGATQTFPWTPGGAKDAVEYLEQLVDESAENWPLNRDEAHALAKQFGKLKDERCEDETKAKLPLTDRLLYLADIHKQTEQMAKQNPLAAG